MPKDTQTKNCKSASSKKKEEAARLRRKQAESSDSDYIDDDDFDEEDEMDMQEYQEFLAKTFPSKHMDKKVKAGKKLKQVLEKDMKKSKRSKIVEESESEEDLEEDDDLEEDIPKKTTRSSKPANKKLDNKKKGKKIIKKEESEEESEESSEEDDDDDLEEEYDKKGKGKAGKFNIIFTIGSGHDEYDDDEFGDEDEWLTCSDEDNETENEDDPVSTDESDSEEEEDEEEEEVKPKKKVVKKASPKKPLAKDTVSKDTVTKESSDKVVEEKVSDKSLLSDKSLDKDSILTVLKDLQSKTKDTALIDSCIKVCEEKLKVSRLKQEKKVKKQKDRNDRIFKRILRDKNTMNDFEFFEKLEIDQQKKIIKELKEINKITRVEKPYRLTLLEANIPLIFKSAALKKISTLRYMEPGSGEFYKIKNWVDTFMRIPFGKFNNLPISIDDGVEKCHDFMANAQKTLDEAVYGLNDAKMQIMQLLGQLVTNPKAIGTAIAIHGPPGTGKCHTYDTPILMYDGSIKMVQDIAVGDIVMGDDSKPRNVLSLGRGEDELYEIMPTKGEKYGVNSEHILCLKPSGINRIRKCKNKNNSISYKTEYLNKDTCKLQSKRFSDLNEAETYLEKNCFENDIIQISVKNYLELPNNVKKNLKGYKTGIDFKEKSVPFDPYIIGVWLGDGTSSDPNITNQEAVILHYIKNEIKKHNLQLAHYSKYTYGITYDAYEHDSRNNKNVFLQVLKDLNMLNNKHIPNIYKINSRENRLKLLAGIIDTDGHYSKKDKGFDIIQKNESLLNDILFLVRSLGYAAYKTECTKSCIYKGNKIEGTYYRLFISGSNLTEIPTKCPRKRAEVRIQNKDPLKVGFTVKSIGKGKYYGFELDDNHRYLLGDFTVTHNTSLVREGISKILNRPFAFIALGGATDSSFLEGHGYTYEGSIWGKIVQILIDSKCMNPVIYFDELDKISETPKGEEIAGILTHLTDTSQNSQFHDKYFAEIDFDLSKCLFIFSYNDESKVNPILKDRMYRIQTKGYNQKQKTVIANSYLLPKIREQVRFSTEDIIIPDETEHYIIDNFCNKEDGVRNLKRCLEIIYTKLNLYRLMRPGSNLFEEDMALKVEFPFKVTKDIVDKLIKTNKENISALHNLYV
jgi:ATP-dependent Lon protease